MVQADEGMWLLSAPPLKLLKERHKFDLTDEWLTRAMKASVRFNNGGSGGFVSPNGLIVTNHHIGASSLQKLSRKDKDYLRDGFYAKTAKQELKCPDLELNVLQEIIDVTDRVSKAVKPDMTPAQANAARRAVMTKIEQESSEKTGLRSDVVTLYQGGLYHLYRYKRYTDVRIVFAPEMAIADFGGDADNFEFPRFCLDVCFFRAYEDGKPIKSPHYFPWSDKGPTEGDIAFVVGHPGSTNRLDTTSMLRHRRDFSLPYLLRRLRFVEALLGQFSARGPEEARTARKELARSANARKAITGQYQGLLDPTILAAKEKAEREFEKMVRKDIRDEAIRNGVAESLKAIAAAQKAWSKFETMYYLLERGDAFEGDLFLIARYLVRLAAEKPKPNSERLREYSEARLKSLELQLFSPAPIYTDLERVRLAGSISFMAELLGGEHPLVLKVLAGKSPAERAAELIHGSKLIDVAERKRLAKGGQKLIDSSSDPLILLAKQIDKEARGFRKRYEEEVEEVIRQGQAKLSAARFKLLGTGIAPDATFTLRLAFGVVKGYSVDGLELPYATTFGGAFERAEKQRHREPFVLPKRWLDGKNKLDLKTPFDFVSTADTIGGNSGSPVLNRAGELVGVNFDRNRHGLVRNFVYTDVQARHISVHSRAVVEALRVLYGADGLVKELLAR
jgi:hypothetical protein